MAWVPYLLQALPKGGTSEQLDGSVVTMVTIYIHWPILCEVRSYFYAMEYPKTWVNFPIAEFELNRSMACMFSCCSYST